VNEILIVVVVLRRKTITKYRLTQQDAFLEDYKYCMIQFDFRQGQEFFFISTSELSSGHCGSSPVTVIEAGS
jgi:hypothetical protein